MGPIVILTIVLVAVITGAAGVAWGQWLEHRRRVAAMDVIKAALMAGKEPPAIVMAELTRAGHRKPPWNEVVVFTALSFGFWVAFGTAGEPARTAFLTVAVTMTVTALGVLLIALISPRGGAPQDDAE
jgi:hypothetical protein